MFLGPILFTLNKTTCTGSGPVNSISWITALENKYFVNHNPSCFERFAKQKEGKTSDLYISTLNVEIFKN